MREGWELTTLDDLCAIEKGSSPTQKTPAGPFPLIVTGPSPLTSDSFQFEGEAVCVPLVSSTGHGHASLKRIHLATGRFAVANIIAACVVREDGRCSARFLWHYLQHLKDDLIVSRMKGTANVSLSLRSLGEVPVALPPLSVQHRIVDLIGAVDGAIEAADEVAGATAATYEAALQTISSSRYPRATVSEVLLVAKAGGTPSRKAADYFGAGTPWLKSGEVDNPAIVSAEESITEAGLRNSSAWIAPAGSTVVAMYGQGNTKGTAGYLEQPMAMNQAVIALVPDTELIDGRLLFHAMRSRTASLRQKAVGAAQPNLSKSLVIGEEIGLPERGAQSSLAGTLDSMLDQSSAATDLATSLRSLRSNLLTALLAGEHEIPESYDALLEGAA